VRIAIFVAPICNQLVASVMHGFRELGHTVYANRGWCCGVYDPACWRIPVIAEWNWCQFVSDADLLELAQNPDVLVIGTVRYASVSYWEHETDGVDAQKAASLQLEAANRGLIDLYIDDGDYALVYSQMNGVPYYFKREPTGFRSVIALPSGLCPWLPVTASSQDGLRPLLFSACFPMAARRRWDRMKTLKALADEFGDLDDIWIGPIKEPTRSRRFVATSNRQGECYLNVLQHSLSSLSLPGEGWDTFRMWEILSCGACLISPRRIISDLSIDPPPREGKEYLGFHDDDELVELLKHYRNERNALATIAAAGQLWAVEHHRGVNRARKVLTTIYDTR